MKRACTRHPSGSASTFAVPSPPGRANNSTACNRGNISRIPSLISIPKSAEEMTRRIENNADLFRTNYGIIFVVILAGCIVSSMTQVVSIVAVGAVCAALSLHEDVETASLWGKRLPMTKNQRLGAAALLALPLLCAADIFSTVLWSLGTIMVIATTHASVHAGLGAPIKSLHKNVPENPEKGE
ncbi:hypothetical protein MTO96_001089 [Rhipicephalus appendiculatus]